ncbi:hypothetical protein Pmani_009899 [Petrolisthes manimaculis]|uniref:Uncharacterized protein n=1 Tax=Petrolisthes manimaculis TaxID=1843537 RepID=A0AAE1Q446_9EUCA|nr:hypothetical protein Pmani_009899 [Petrolisthes manimaculis]
MVTAQEEEYITTVSYVAANGGGLDVYSPKCSRFEIQLVVTVSRPPPAPWGGDQGWFNFMSLVYGLRTLGVVREGAMGSTVHTYKATQLILLMRHSAIPVDL